MTGEHDLLERVRTAWADVLAVEPADQVPLDTSFLEAGGNSLLLVLLWEELSALTEAPLRMSDLFQHGTVRAQAALLAGERAAVAEVGPRDRAALLGRARRGEQPNAVREQAAR